MFILKVWNALMAIEINGIYWYLLTFIIVLGGGWVMDKINKQ